MDLSLCFQRLEQLHEIELIPIPRLNSDKKVHEPPQSDPKEAEPINYYRFHTFRAHLNYRPLDHKMGPESMTQVRMDQEFWEFVYSAECDEKNRKKKVKSVKSASAIKVHHAVQSVLRKEFSQKEAAEHFGVPITAIHYKLTHVYKNLKVQ